MAQIISAYHYSALKTISYIYVKFSVFLIFLSFSEIFKINPDIVSIHSQILQNVSLIDKIKKNL